MSASDASTEDVILLQLGLKYGVQDMTNLAERLKVHPLLNQTHANHGVTNASQCRASLQKLLGVKDLQHATSDLMTQILSQIREVRLGNLIEEIGHAEQAYAESRAAGVTISPRQGGSAETTAALATTTTTGPGAAATITTTTGSTASSAPAAHQAATGPDEKLHEGAELQRAGSAEAGEVKPLIEEIEEAHGAQSPAANSPAALQPQQSQDKAILSPDRADQPFKAPEQIPTGTEGTTGFVSQTGRTTRTRSNTITTVLSNDESQPAPPTETETDVTTKRRPGRGRKRSKSVAEHTPAPSREASAASTSDAQAIAASKKFQSTILTVLASIASHKCASIFAFPVSVKEAPSYRDLIRQPTDLKTIKARIKSGEIGDGTAFHLEMCKMFSNAIMFNHDNSDVAEMTREMYDFAEVSDQRRPAACDTDFY